MVELLRVDHRLLHGQVVFSWCSALNPDCILVANDEAVSDELRKTTLRMSKPAGVKLVIKSVDDSIAAINAGKTHGQPYRWRGRASRRGPIKGN